MENEKLIYRLTGERERELRALWQATTLQERVSLFEDEKDRIGQFAAQLIRDGESVMMDGGSTTLAVARHLHVHQRLLVITNTSTIGELLVGNKNNQVILTGGELIAGTNSVIGPSRKLQFGSIGRTRRSSGIGAFAGRGFLFGHP
jgi:DeoR/GlpR family transcriptional regulator of sugar metabolism